MRVWLASVLHSVGVHVLCRRRSREVDMLVPMILPDGTLWKPDVNGVTTYRVEVHG